jgi:cellulose synthase/poly-beta-1,6-N-acetylglucosamine synthase-like glycosyltransferase
MINADTHQEGKLSRWVRRHPIKSQRLLEILPGFVSWFLITFPLWGSVLIPEIVAYYIITFNVYWLYRSFSMATLAIFAHFKINASQRYDWVGDLKTFDDWEKIHHIVVIPTYQEPLHILERTLKALSRQSFPTKRISVMVSFEEREGEAAIAKADALTKAFGAYFHNFWTTFHPDIEGEVKGKSSNTSWGAKIAKQRLVDEMGIPIEYVTITSEDADAVLHEHYFSALAYHFLDSPQRYYRIWQAGIMFYNNIWRVPAPVRVMASVFSVFQLYVLMRPDSLMNFSTYSTSLKLIDEIGYWDVDVIPEDYRLFFKAYFATEGKVEVEPIFVPVYNDAAEADGFWETMVNQYEQIKRWAWGVSDDAYIIKRWLTVPNLPFWDKTLRVLHVLESHFLWPVNWFAITIGALLPPLINPEFSRTILGKTLPQLSSTILTISLVSMVVIFVIDAINRPPRPHKVSILKKLLQPLEFVLLPVIGLFFSALPGIDAHTRLMLGRYIEYRVTKKV